MTAITTEIRSGEILANFGHGYERDYPDHGFVVEYRPAVESQGWDEWYETYEEGRARLAAVAAEEGAVLEDGYDHVFFTAPGCLTSVARLTKLVPAQFPPRRLVSLRATRETCDRQLHDDDRDTLPKVAERLWRAFQRCFPSCETLMAPLAFWPTATVAELDADLYRHRSNQVDESWTHPDPMPGSASIETSDERLTVSISSAGGRVFAAEYGRSGDSWRLVAAGVEFGERGSIERALALGFAYLDFADGDRAEYGEADVELLWSAMPEIEKVIGGKEQ